MFITRKTFEEYKKAVASEFKSIEIWSDQEISRVRKSSDDLRKKYEMLMDHLHLKEIQIPSSYKLVPAEEEQKK